MATTLRLKFERTGPVRYIGHLDMLRYFQKAVMRASLDIRYSEGFNPHQIMSFAYPLGVSMETRGDYLDIDVLSFESCEDITKRLNLVMSEGIRILNTTIVAENSKNAMSSVAAADYRVHVCEKEILSQEVLNRFMSQKEIIVQKDTGKKVTETDILPGIYELSMLEKGDVFMKLKSGSEMNVKATTVLEALSLFIGQTLSTDLITRMEIYGYDETMNLKPLGEL